MATPYNHLAPKLHSRQDVLTVFGPHPTADVSRLYRENKSLYDALKIRAIELGILDIGTIPQTQAPYVLPYSTEPKPEALTDRDRQVRAAHSFEEVKELFAGKSVGARVNIGTIAATDSERFKSLRASAISYGLLADENGNTRPIPTKEQLAAPPEGHVQISDELSDKAGLKRGAFHTKEKVANIKIGVAYDEREAAAKNPGRVND